MSLKDKALPLVLLPHGVTFARPGHDLPERVELDDPATLVMTDLTRVAAITAPPGMSIGDAEKRMGRAGVRMLLVVDSLDDVLGLVTLTDIKGDRPLRFQQENGIRHEEILVHDIMTPRERLEAIPIAEVERALVRDILQTLKRAGRQHALVVEAPKRERAIIRGIFSLKQIGMQLGVEVESATFAATFAELEAAIGR